MLKLVEGRHINSSDKNTAMVHKKFAELNNYKLGDKIKLDAIELVYGYNGTSYKLTNNSIEVEIVGIFERENQTDAWVGYDFELIENEICLSNNAVAKLYGYTDKTSYYEYVMFNVKKGFNTDKIISDIKKLPNYSRDLQILKGEDVFTALSSSYDVMIKFINILLIGSAVIGIVILSLILKFWIQERTHEIGILLSIGIKKSEILAQHIIELLMIGTIAFSLSFLPAKAISQNIGNSLVEKSKEAAVKEVNSGFNGMQVGNDILTSRDTYTKDYTIDVNVTLNELINVWIIGTGIIIVSVGLSSFSVIKLRPRKILTNMQ